MDNQDGFAVGTRFGSILAYIERHATLYAGLGFGAGLLAGLFLPFAGAMEAIREPLIDSYDHVAPFVIYFILAPSLLRIAQEGGRKGARFSLFTALWFARLRIAACLFAVFAVAAIYGLPLTSGAGSESFGSSLATAMSSLGKMLVQSPYFYAIYASIATIPLLYRSRGRLVSAFARLPELVEKIGEYLTHIVPLFTFMVGIFVATLPVALESHFKTYPTETFGQVAIFGLKLDPTTALGIFWIYCIVSVTTGFVSMLWHLGLLAYVKLKLESFSISQYFRRYYIKIYPLLWATSSESLATPLNIHLLKKQYPQIDADVRRFAVSIGSVININGTLTCCFVMIPAVCMMLGLEVSLLDLLLCFPVIYIIGFGVPGIPGELVLFAGPIVAMLGVPAALQDAFLLTFLGLQLGLPDSFRTGANSTDEGPASLLLNEIYHQRFHASVSAPIGVVVEEGPDAQPL